MTTGFIHQNMFRIVGMSRSGNHAVIDWLLRQLSGRWCFLNCVEPLTNPLHSARPRDDGRSCIVGGPGPAEDRAGGLAPMDHVLFSQEDTFLNGALGPAATRIQEEALGAARRIRNIVILRDPWNLFASRRRFGCQAVTEGTAVRIWKQHARAVLGERRFGSPILPVSYNAWVASPSYRREVAASLGLDAVDPGIDSVARCGGGSSFDGHAFDGCAPRMAVFDRWRHYAGDRSFWVQFDAQVIELAGRLAAAFPAGPAAAVKAPAERCAEVLNGAAEPMRDRHGSSSVGRASAEPARCGAE